MSGAPLIAEEDDPVHESALDWSVSGISSVSEFDPNQFTRENAPTPDLTSIGRDEIDQLVDNVRDIRNSLASISEKTATPTNSPRTENNTVIRNISTGHTPPVKDVGLDSDVGKVPFLYYVSTFIAQNLIFHKSHFLSKQKNLFFNIIF